MYFTKQKKISQLTTLQSEKHLNPVDITTYYPYSGEINVCKHYNDNLHFALFTFELISQRHQ